MRYIEVSEHELKDARPGIQLVESLYRERETGTDLYLYGLTSKANVLLAATKAIDEDADLEGEGNAPSTSPRVPEVAVALPLSSDTLYYLSGSGLSIEGEYFAFQGAGAEGPRTMNFSRSNSRPEVRLSDFSVMAVADGMDWIDEFLKEHATAAAVAGEVVRQPVPATRTSSVNPIDTFLAG